MNNIDLLRQYVDTGIPLPEHQVANLPSGLIKTYFRKRLIACEQRHDVLAGYELGFMPEQMRGPYMDVRVSYANKQNKPLLPEEMAILNKAQLASYLDIRFKRVNLGWLFMLPYEYQYFQPHEMEWYQEQSVEAVKHSKGSHVLPLHLIKILNPKLKQAYYELRLSNISTDDDYWPIEEREFTLMPPEFLPQYFQTRLKGITTYEKPRLTGWELDFMSPEQKDQYLTTLIQHMESKGETFDTYQVNELTPKHKQMYADYRFKSIIENINNRRLSDYELDILSPEQKQAYLTARVNRTIRSNGWSEIARYELEVLPTDLLRGYLASRLKFAVDNEMECLDVEKMMLPPDLKATYNKYLAKLNQNR